MKLVILAGGKGTRLGFECTPKPMVEIDGIPNIERQILLAKRYGIKDIYILSGYLANVIFDYFKNGHDFGVNITHIIEPYPLGTAGSVKLLENIVDDRFIVFYGDVVMDMDIASFIQFDNSHSNSIASILVHPNDHPYDSDLVELDCKNRVSAFHSKPHAEDKYYSNLVNAAVYILSPKIFHYISLNTSSDFGKDIFPKLLEHGEIVMGYRNAEYVKDMGTKDRLKKVIADVASGKVCRLNKINKRAAIFVDRDGTVNEYVDNLSHIKEFVLYEKTAEAIKLINQSEYLAILVTNQPMVAKGFLKEDDLAIIHKKMETELGRQRAYFDAIYYCPHHPDKGYEGEVREYKKDCICRKPDIGMITEAVRDYNIDLSSSFIIGDSTTDIATGRKAGLKTILLKTGIAGNDGKCNVEPDFVVEDLFTAVRNISEVMK